MPRCRLLAVRWRLVRQNLAYGFCVRHNLSYIPLPLNSYAFVPDTSKSGVWIFCTSETVVYLSIPGSCMFAANGDGGRHKKISRLFRDILTVKLRFRFKT